MLLQARLFFLDMFQPSSIHPLRHFNVSPPVYLSFVLLSPLKSSSLIDTDLIHLEEIRLQPERVPVADWAQRWSSSGGTAVPHTLQQTSQQR